MRQGKTKRSMIEYCFNIGSEVMECSRIDSIIKLIVINQFNITTALSK